MALTDFTIIRRSMSARMFSTVTTIITVAVAAGLMLVLLSMRDAGRKAFERGAGNMHLLVSADSAALPAILNGIFYANPPQRPITWRKYESLANAFPFEYAIPVQMGDSYRGQPVLATNRMFFTDFKPDIESPWQVREGRLFENDFEIVVGAAAARATGLRIGDQIALTHGAGAGAGAAHVHNEYPFTVVGLMNVTGTPHDRALFTTLESSWIIHAHDRVAAASGDPEQPLTQSDLIEADRLITGIYLRVLTRPGSDATAVLAQIFDQLRRDTSITVAQPTQQITNLFRIVGNIDQIFLGLAGVVMVSSGIAVMLALYNSMEQRRRQIAVLRVLGCSRPRIFGLVVTESAMLGLLGAIVGLALCLLGVQVVAAIMKERLGIVVNAELSARWVLVVVLGTVFLASIAGIVPAILAYRTSVARNLKPIG